MILTPPPANTNAKPRPVSPAGVKYLGAGKSRAAGNIPNPARGGRT